MMKAFCPDDEENMPKGMVPLADILNADAEDKTNVGCPSPETKITKADKA